MTIPWMRFDGIEYAEAVPPVSYVEWTRRLARFWELVGLYAGMAELLGDADAVLERLVEDREDRVAWRDAERVHEAIGQAGWAR